MIALILGLVGLFIDLGIILAIAVGIICLPFFLLWTVIRAFRN